MKQFILAGTRSSRVRSASRFPPLTQRASISGVDGHAEPDGLELQDHGQYVKAMGGGDGAASSCIGMPINSNQ